MKAKHFVAAALVASLITITADPAFAHAGASAGTMQTDPTAIEVLTERAYVWGMPLVEAALIRERFTSAQTAGEARVPPLNRFEHRRLLAGPEMRVGVGPNNDTIYSLAWIDLLAGPLVITTPDFGDRYYTFSINFAIRQPSNR